MGRLRYLGRLAAALASALYLIAMTPASWSQAEPNSAEQRFLADLYQYVHPSVTALRLVELGMVACAVRTDGGSSYDARDAVWRNLNAAGVVSSNAEMGTLVHVAVDHLCPEVGYP